MIITGVTLGGGIHTPGYTPLRKNYPAIGYTYDATRDAFIPPNPYPSWLLDETTCLWNAPTAMPTSVDGKMYAWNEETVSWKEIAV